MEADEAWLGVDFGTSNTVALIGLPGREPRPLMFDGSPLLPSAVCADSGGRLLVGRDALHTAAANPAGLELHPKRCIDDGLVLLGGHEVPVAELIGAVLTRVAEEAVRVGERMPAGTVLTFPAAWRDARREILLTAAGQVLPDVRLLTEPVAAAGYFVEVAGGRVPEGGCAVVCDFGAGTFDASVVRRTAAGFEVLAAEGIIDAGGLDIDAAIVAYLGEVLGTGQPDVWARVLRPESPGDRRASRQLWDNVRSAKEMLSRATTTLVYIPGLDVEAPLGREQLEQLAAPLLARTVAATRSALRAAGVADKDIAAVFLTGGSSRLTAIPTVIHRAFGILPTIVDQPVLAVAEGAVRSSALATPTGGVVTFPMLSSPVSGSPVSGSPVSGIPVSGLPVSGSPVSGSPVSGAPVSGGSVSGGSVSGGSVSGGLVPSGPDLGGSDLGGSTVEQGWASGTTVPVLPLPLPAPPPPSPGERGRPWRRRALVAVAVLLVLGLGAGIAYTLLPGPDPRRPTGAAGASGSAHPTASAPASASPAPVTGAACLIGKWRVVSRQESVTINGKATPFTGGKNEVDSYSADNVWTVDDSATDYTVAVIGGVTWKALTRGKATGHYTINGGNTIQYATSSVTGTWRLYRNGSVNNSGTMSIGVQPEKFTCKDNSLQQFGPAYAVDLVRIG